ncbi:hypothetical protein [Hafnia paralvei]|nr:hypothetical protein [Hafnia paralvei]
MNAKQRCKLRRLERRSEERNSADAEDGWHAKSLPRSLDAQREQ